MIYFLNLFVFLLSAMIRQTIAKLRIGSVLGWLYIGAVVIAATYMLLQPKKPSEKPEPRPRTEMDVLADRVRAINGNLVRLFFDGFSPMISPPIDCRIADRAKLNNRSPDEQKILDPKIASWSERCNIATAVNAQLIENFRSIADHGDLPEGLHAFQVYLEDDWRTVGVFLTKPQCEEALSRTATAGLGIKNCQEWKPQY